MSCSRLGSSSSAVPSSELDIRTANYEDVKQRTSLPVENSHVIDVREPHELAAHGFIPSAKNIPLSILKEALVLDPEAFKAKVGHEKPAVHHELLFYCRSGRRAATACEAALEHGYKNVLNYKGSWIDWIERERT